MTRSSAAERSHAHEQRPGVAAEEVGVEACCSGDPLDEEASG